MPNTKSAKKRLRQSLERRTRNRMVKSTLRTLVRKAREAATGSDVAAAAEAAKVASRGLDQAASKGVIHKNAAARTKSRLQSLIKKKKAG
jgi:small subunit ribosomal protein S20